MVPWRILAVFAVLGFVSGSPISLEESQVSDENENERVNQNTLRQVTVVMRHGERAPQDTYPNDPYINDTMKPYGWGQLTKVGRISQYNQGVYLHHRYGKFLGPTYHPNIFWLQCTAVDRTKMSALLEAAGLWEPEEDQLFIPNLHWQPVTFYYQPLEEDTLLLIWSMSPKYAQMRSEITDFPEVQKVQQENKQLYEELTNFTGMPIENPDDVASLHGTLTAEEDMGFELPDWTKKYYPEKLEPLTIFSLALNTFNDDLRRLKGGPMVKKIIDNMVAKKEDTLEPKDRKMFMYVGHDSTVVTLLDTMHVWNKEMPIYNIMVMIELHENEDGYNVQMFLRNSTDHAPYPLTLPGCSTVCPLKKFVELLKPMIPDDWEEESKICEGCTAPPPPAP